MRRGPIVFDADQLDDASTTPADAAPVPDLTPMPVMERGLRIAARKPSWFGRLVRWSLGTLISMAVGFAFWDFVLATLARNVWLGHLAMGLTAILLLGIILFVLKELAGMARLAKIDRLQKMAVTARAAHDREAVLRLNGDLAKLYSNRHDLRLGMAKLREQSKDLLDADALLDLAERQLMSPLDRAAQAEIEGASRSVAATTALVPLALADVAVALTANIRMVRRIAEIYGGRAGTFGSMRLLRAVATHLLATGAVAVGDDLIGSVAGGGALSKISRRFGEGVVNGALTARVGIAAIEVCRPMPFSTESRPRVTQLVKRALTGLFQKG